MIRHQNDLSDQNECNLGLVGMNLGTGSLEAVDFAAVVAVAVVAVGPLTTTSDCLWRWMMTTLDALSNWIPGSGGAPVPLRRRIVPY